MNTKLYNKEYFDNREKGAKYRPKLFKFQMEIQKYNPKTVLDIGCGHGFLVKRLLERDIEAMGIDISEYAGKQIPMDFIKTDAKKLPIPDNEFDVVFSSDFFEHIPEEDIEQVYSEMKRVGKYIIAYINTKEHRFHKDPTHVTLKTKEEWQKLLPDVRII